MLKSSHLAESASAAHPHQNTSSSTTTSSVLRSSKPKTPKSNSKKAKPTKYQVSDVDFEKLRGTLLSHKGRPTSVPAKSPSKKNGKKLIKNAAEDVSVHSSGAIPAIGDGDGYAEDDQPRVPRSQSHSKATSKKTKDKERESRDETANTTTTHSTSAAHKSSNLKSSKKSAHMSLAVPNGDDRERYHLELSDRKSPRRKDAPSLGSSSSGTRGGGGRDDVSPRKKLPFSEAPSQSMVELGKVSQFLASDGPSVSTSSGSGKKKDQLMFGSASGVDVETRRRSRAIVGLTASSDNAITRADSLLKLPYRTMLYIFSFLTCKDLGMAEQVCTTLKLICSDNELWKTVITREWANKRILKGFGKKHLTAQKKQKSMQISKQMSLASVDYKQELKNHLQFKRQYRTGKPIATIKNSAVWTSRVGLREPCILMIGLDDAGKTTLLYDAIAGARQLIHPIPTVGYNSETMQILGQEFAISDAGGLSQLRHTWENYIAGAGLLIWVIDSADIERAEESRAELIRVLNRVDPAASGGSGDPAIPGRKMLVLANKQDANGAMDARAVVKALGLDSNPVLMQPDWDWYVQPCTVMTASGREAAMAGFEWLVRLDPQQAKLTPPADSLWSKIKNRFQ